MQCSLQSTSGKQHIPTAGEVEIVGFSFKLNCDMKNASSYTANDILIPIHLRHLSGDDVLNKIMQYINAELRIESNFDAGAAI